MIYENWYQDIPEYDGSMYLKGYTPEEILMAFRKSIYEDLEDQDTMETFLQELRGMRP